MDLRKTRQFLVKLICLITLVALASCGQKGELYLPDKGQTSFAQQHTNS